MNYIIFDLEATCWQDKNSAKNNETIEIGAVLINENKEIVSEFCRFIKPLENPILSDFCKQLTTITQDDIDNAEEFSKVIAEFQQWITQGGNDYVLCSWGFYDKKQFTHDCRLHGLDTKWLKNHISIKHQYATIHNPKKSIGMKTALLNEGFTLTGTHHRGIDDAKNITKIFIKYFDKWNFNLK